MKRTFGLVFVLALAASPALAQKVTVDYAHDFDFSGVKSFQYVDTKDSNSKNELMAGRIAMVGAIAAAGYFGLHPPGFAAGTVALAFGLGGRDLAGQQLASWMRIQGFEDVVNVLDGMAGWRELD